MAVIREQRQFSIGPIGVARASQAGTIVGEAVSNSANSMADIFFREASVQAEKRGLEAGASQSREKILTINPNTGAPEAYEPPSAFGSIASDAYQKVVMRRFEESLDDEMQNKAKELAVKYEANPNGVALYESAMSDYIAAMSNASEGPFKSYIQDVGTAYLQATRTNLAINQIRREREVFAAAQSAAIERASNDVESLVSQFGPVSLSGPTQVMSLIESARQTASDGQNAGIFDGTAVSRATAATQLSAARGLIRYASKSTSDPETLELIQQAIGTQNPSLFPAGYEYLADAMTSFGSNYGALEDIEKFSDGLFGDAIQYAKVVRDQNIRREAAETNRRIVAMGSNSAAIDISRQNSAFGTMPSVTVDVVRNFTANYNDQIMAAAGNDDLVKALTDRRDSETKAALRGLYLQTLSGLGTKDTQALEAAIFERNVSLAPESARVGLQAILRLEGTYANAVDDFLPLIGEKRDAAGKFIDAEFQQQAVSSLNTFVPRINDVSLLRGPQINVNVNDLIGAISSIPNLPSEARDGAFKEIRLGAAKASVSQFFGTNPTKEQISDAQAYLAGGDVTAVLNDAQRKILDQGRTYAVDSGRESELRTHFNQLSSNAFDRISAADKDVENRRMVQQILLGQGIPTNPDQRKLLDQHIENTFRPALGNRTLASVWSDPAALTDPALAPMFTQLRGLNVLPSSLHDLLTATANGVWSGGDLPTALSHYANYRNYEYAGQELSNPAMFALTAKERATLDFLVDAMPTIGSDPAALAQVFKLRSELATNPAFQQRIEATFGGTLEEAILGLKGIESASLSAVNDMTAFALEMFKVGVPQGMSGSDILDRVQRQFDSRYVEGGGVVFDSLGNPRTAAPISFAAPGNEDLFLDYARDLAANFQTEGRLFTFDKKGIVARNLDRFPMTDIVYLEPFGIPGANGVYQYVMKMRRPAEKGGDILLTRDYNGERGPIIVSNADPVFRDILSRENLKRDVLLEIEAQRTEAEIQADRDRISAPSLELQGVME